MLQNLLSNLLQKSYNKLKVIREILSMVDKFAKSIMKPFEFAIALMCDFNLLDLFIGEVTKAHGYRSHNAVHDF